MTEHQQMVRSLQKSGEEIFKTLDKTSVELWHMATGISGEAGELLDAIKKKAVYFKELDFENVVEELGDLEFYLEGMRQILGVTRGECLRANIAKLSKRYTGLKYTDQAAIERKDKQ